MKKNSSSWNCLQSAVCEGTFEDWLLIKLLFLKQFFALHRRDIATVLPFENNLSFIFCYFSMLWNMFVALTTHKIQKLSIHQFFYHGLSCSQGAEAFSSCFRVKPWLHLWICHQPFAHTGPNRETSNTSHTHLQSYWPAECRCSCLDTGRKCKPHTQPQPWFYHDVSPKNYGVKHCI